MRTTLTCARRVLSLSVAAALGAPLMAVAAPTVVADGVVVTVDDDTIVGTPGQLGGHAVSVVNGGTLNATNADISASGQEAHAVSANGASSSVNIEGGRLSTSGAVGAAVRLSGASELTLSGATVETTGRHGQGVWATGGASADISNSSITTRGNQARAAWAAGAGSQLSVTNSQLETFGDRQDGNGAVALVVENGASAQIVGTSITTHGYFSGGIEAAGAGSTITMSGGSITTEGDSATAAVGYGQNASLRLDGVSILTSGESSKGAVVRGETTSLDITGSSIQTSGLTAHAVHVREGAHADVSDTRIDTSGDLAHGIYAETGGTAAATNTDIVTTGGEAYGLLVDGEGSRVEFTGGSITTSGESADGVKVTNGASALVDGTTVNIGAGGLFTNNVGAELGSQLDVRNSTLHNVGSQVEGQPTHGVDSRDAGTVVNVSDTAITMEGRRGSGLFANTDGVLNAVRTTVNTSGNLGHGLLMGDGATVSLVDSDLTTSGESANGASVTGGQLSAVGTSLSTSGLASTALLLSGQQSSADVRDSSLSTTGNMAHGINAKGGGTANVTGTSIATAGDVDAHGIFAESNGRVSVSNSTVTTTGANRAHGLAAATGGAIQADNVSIHTQGQWSRGVDARDNGSIEISNSDFITEGTAAHGLLADVGGRIVSNGTHVHTMGSGAQGVLAMGGEIVFNNGSVLNEGTQTHGLQASSSGILTADGASVRMLGQGSSAVYVESNGTFTGNNLTLLAEGDAGKGVFMNAPAAAPLSLRNSSILVTGANASGIEILAGQGSFDTVEVATTGTASSALKVSSAQASANVLNSALSTSGKDAHAAWADGGANVEILGSQLSTNGGAARGVNATKGSQVKLADSTIHTNSGDLRDAHGVYANGGSNVDVNNVEIITEGARSRGLLGDAATITADRVSIATSGSESIGVLGINGAALSLSNVAISTTGERGHGISNNSGSHLLLDGAAVETSGENAFGVIVRNDGSHADLSNLQVLTHGSNAIGLSVDYGTSSAVLADSQIVTEGAGSNAVRVQEGASLDISNSVLSSQAASALHFNNGSLTATDGTVIEGNGTLATFGSDTANTLVFDRDVVALGDIRFADGALDSDGNGSLDRTSSLSLDNNSYWQGATDAIGDLSLANGSRWDVTGNSTVGNLSLADSSVVFDHADGQYKTLTVDGNFHADNGLLAMNTALGDDASPTDLLHVKGDTSGSAHIAVNNIGGTGAQTEDGIKLVQVDGVSAGEYALAGRAVGGAYEYFLFHGGRADPNDGDWYLRSELSPVDPVIDPVVDPPVDPVVDPIIDPPMPTPVFRPEAGAYLANQASALGLFDMDLHERVGEPNLAQRQRGDGKLGSAWARVITEQPRYRVNDQLVGQGRHNVVQIGSDLTFWGNQDRGVVGVMAASGQATNRITSELTGYGAEGRVDGRALGVYGTWMQNAEDDDGLYIDGWLQAAQFKNRVQGDALAREEYRSHSLSASLEAGYAVRLHQNENSALYLEPQVQAIWTDYRMDGGQHQEVNGTVVKSAEAGGLQTRVGARLYGHWTSAEGNRVQPFVAVNWIRNGSDANAVWLGNQRLQGVLPNNVYEAKAGAQLQLSPKLTGWGELSIQNGDYGFRSVGGQLGVKYAW